MALLVLAFPVLDAFSSQRIESVRKNRDDTSRASVPPHLTLGFVRSAVGQQVLVEHAHHEALGSKAKDDCLSAQLELLDGDAVITGSIDALDVVEYDGSRVTRVDRVRLT
jgi:hypothetical protein